MYARFCLMALMVLFICGVPGAAAPGPEVNEDAVTRPDSAEIVDWMRFTAPLTAEERGAALEGIVARLAGGAGEAPRSDFLTAAALAHRGDGKAQYCVGQAYEHGLGVVEDLTDAYVWYAIAARSGFAAAAEARERVKTLLVSVYPAPTDEELDTLQAEAQGAIARLQAEAGK